MALVKKLIKQSLSWMKGIPNKYLRLKYQSLVGRRGKKRTLIAVGHKILISTYHIVRDKASYRELGATYLDRLRNRRRTVDYLIKRLESFGYRATLEAIA